MKITVKIRTAIERGAKKVKRMEATTVPVELQADSMWLSCVNNIIDWTAQSIQDEIKKIK
jgi:hypothetical protein